MGRNAMHVAGGPLAWAPIAERLLRFYAECTRADGAVSDASAAAARPSGGAVSAPLPREAR
jgi:hypothetical protein